MYETLTDTCLGEVKDSYKTDGIIQTERSRLVGGIIPSSSDVSGSTRWETGSIKKSTEEIKMSKAI